MSRHKPEKARNPSLQSALQAHSRGDFAAAESAYRALLARHPAQGDAHNLLGTLLHQTGRDGEALHHMLRAVELLPGFADAHSNLGMVELAMGHVDDALRAFDAAIALRPGHWNAHGMRADAYLRKGMGEAARQDLRVAVRENPGWVDGWCRLAAAYNDSRDFASAASALRTAASLRPGAAEILRDLGICLRRAGDCPASRDVLEQAVRLAPGQAKMSCQLAWTLFEDKRYLDAVDWFERATAEQGPAGNRQDALIGMGTALNAIGLADRALEVLAEARAIDPGAATLYSPYLSAQIYSGAVSKDARFRSHREWAATLVGEEIPVRPVRRSPPWRIGLLSGDLRNHAVARFLLSWMGLSRDRRFEYVAYATHERDDEISDRLRSQFVVWRNVARIDDEALRATIRGDEIDVLVELSGHTFPNRLPALAVRAAPIQATWLGYPETTGLDTIDYRLTDALCDPPGEEAWVSERLARLPGGFLCYAPIGDEASASPGRVERQEFVFGCFNNLSKVTPELVAAFSRILHAASASVLILKHYVLDDPRVRHWMHERFAELGVPAERVLLLAPKASAREHLDSYNQVDLALDTFPYNGTTTTCEALWMGVPVLGMRGDRHAGRVGESILGQVFGTGAGAWLAENVDDFVARAVAACAAGARAQDQRLALRRVVEQSSLMDGAAFARKIEAEFERWIDDRAADGPGGAA